MPKKSSGPFLKFREDRGIYEIIWYERGDRKRKSTGASSRPEAEIAFGEFLLENHRADGPADPDRRLIGDVLADYLTERGPLTDPKSGLADTVERLTDFWGETPVSDIDEKTCREYMRFRDRKAREYRRRKYKKETSQRGVKPGAMRRELAILQAALNHDHRAKRLTHPVYVWKPAAAPPRDRWLTRDEAAKLLRAAHRTKNKPLCMFILMGIYTGARREAILSLRWPQVNFTSQRIDFNPPGRAITKKGRAKIPFPDQLQVFLRLWRRRGSDLGYVIHDNQRRIADLKIGFRRAAEEAGLLDVSPHTLRHTCATWLVQNNVPMAKVAAWLGHAESSTTERFYAHNAPEFLDDVAGSLKRRRATLPPQIPPQKARSGAAEGI